MKAIITKYIKPSDRLGSRIKATCEGKSVTLHLDHSLSADKNHDAAAKALIEKIGMTGRWYRGTLPDGKGVAYVLASRDYITQIWESDNSIPVWD